MKRIYKGVPGGLAVEVIRIDGSIATVAVLSQWHGGPTGQRMRVNVGELEIAR